MRILYIFRAQALNDLGDMLLCSTLKRSRTSYVISYIRRMKYLGFCMRKIDKNWKPGRKFTILGENTSERRKISSEELDEISIHVSVYAT